MSSCQVTKLHVQRKNPTNKQMKQEVAGKLLGQLYGAKETRCLAVLSKPLMISQKFTEPTP
jgi:hypothetical protein